MTATMTSALPLTVGTCGEVGDPFLFKRVRSWWTLLALLMLTDENTLFSVATGPGKSFFKLRQYYDVSTPLLLLSSVMLWGIVAGLVVNRLGPTLRLMLRQKATLLIALLAFLSIAWSQDPNLTFRKSIWLFLTCVFAWLFASSYSPIDQIRLLLAAGIIIGMSSVAMALFLPKYGLDVYGQWKGVLGQKNQLAHAILFLFSGLPFCEITSGRRSRALILQAILAGGLIVLSQSMGSMILAVLLIVVRVSGPLFKSKRREQLPFITFVVVCGIFAAVFGREIIYGLVGRDSTLTGRTHEWAVLFPYTFRHFWLGYGYQGFWSGTGDSLYAMKMIGAAMRGSDSGYIDTMLQLGLAGMTLWLICLLVSLRDFMRVFRREAVPLTTYWYAGIILATIVGSYTDGFFPVSGGIAPFIFVLACAGLGDLADRGPTNGGSGKGRLRPCK
jgi:exopolysaccharide production protein ExoQ